MSETTRKPAVFEADDTKLTVEAPPREAPPKIDPVIAEIETELADAPLPAVRVPQKSKRWRWGRLLVVALGALMSLAFGLAVTQLIEDLFARYEWLGWAGVGLIGISGLALLAIIIRELLALRRMRHIGAIRTAADRGLRHEDDVQSRAAVRDVRELYDGRADLAWGLARLAEHDGEIIDPPDRLKLAERELMAPLDGEARQIISQIARRVSVITAVNPAAVLDVAFVAAQILTLLRRLATLYGGRPGTLGTLKLGRMVLAHLAVTGSLAMTDNLIHHVLGPGLAGRLSAKLGQGAVNGIMTARIGIAALDLCRPLPFAALEPPSLQSVIGGVFTSAKNSDG